MRHWLYMATAILTEVIGTLAMKYGMLHDARGLGLGVMYGMLVMSYTALALAVARIPLAVAYGAWESLGLVLITLCSAWLFSETLGAIKVAAIGAIILGIVLLERGTEEGDHAA
ncbi:multidrug transporter subunit MdtJ [Dyella jejuensis]|uniref:Spermidine export protein MdtJ n=1 Tax=Dyella jejuensis TaxID=1432009 RepID=A0ABW8JF37_9GAMM